ncbi:LysR family transcriptional regulator [Noviherbaspirillum sedimenti]|nr:LysR family transcriptional regulator [Noviherbaspirillum sedimenti]
MDMASKAQGILSAAPAMTREQVDLNLLYVFDVVMTERHVTRAAERLDMTQSAVSNALNRLRRQFQDQLFVKAARGVSPTPRALALWASIHQSIKDLHASMQPEVFDAAHANQRFRIALVDITASLLTPHLSHAVHSLAPGVSFFFVPYDPALTAARLMRGEIDFAIGVEPARAAVLQTLPLWSDTFVVAARRGHPLLDGDLSLEDFCAAPQIAINEPGDEDAPNMIDDALANLGRKRNIRLSVNQFSVIPPILHDSDLIAVLPTRFVETPYARGALASRSLPFAVPEVTLYLSWHQRSNTLPSHQWLKQRMIEAAGALNRAATAR